MHISLNQAPDKAAYWELEETSNVPLCPATLWAFQPGWQWISRLAYCCMYAQQIMCSGIPAKGWSGLYILLLFDPSEHVPRHSKQLCCLWEKQWIRRSQNIESDMKSFLTLYHELQGVWLLSEGNLTLFLVFLELTNFFKWKWHFSWSSIKILPLSFPLQ